MMMLRCEGAQVAACAIGEEARDAGDGRRARAGIRRDCAVGLALCDLLGDLETLAPCLQLAQRADVAEELRGFILVFAVGERLAQSLEPRVRAPVAFGEAVLRHDRGSACTP